jgi:class 3 adenylate cyclase
MESDHVVQVDYDILSINEVDCPRSSDSELHGWSHLGLEWSSSASRLAQYLTRKGSGVDASIKWGETPPFPDARDPSPRPITSHKRNIETRSEIESVACRKRHRRATVADLTADMEIVKKMLDASLPKYQSEWNEKIFVTAGCSRKLLSAADSNSEHNDCLRTNLHPRRSDSDCEIKEAGKSFVYPRAILRTPSTESSCLSVASSLHSLSSVRSLSSRTGSMRLSTHTAQQATVLFIDIKGFTSACAAMPASRVGEWVADFYQRVDAAAAAHGVSKVEVRGDCCVCVTGIEGAVPSRAFAPAAADPRADQATRMLAFAAALHDDLRTLSVAGAATATRMGVATGEVAFLVSTAAAAASGAELAAAAAHFASAQGEAVALAARMEALAGPGAVYVHRSALHKWAAEARRLPPPTECVDGGAGRGPQWAAVFDCAERAFRTQAPPRAPPTRLSRLRRCASSP